MTQNEIAVHHDTAPAQVQLRYAQGTGPMCKEQADDDLIVVASLMAELEARGQQRGQNAPIAAEGRAGSA
jgi:hypothetical protein